MTKAHVLEISTYDLDDMPPHNPTTRERLDEHSEIFYFYCLVLFFVTSDGFVFDHLDVLL